MNHLHFALDRRPYLSRTVVHAMTSFRTVFCAIIRQDLRASTVVLALALRSPPVVLADASTSFAQAHT